MDFDTFLLVEGTLGMTCLWFVMILCVTIYVGGWGLQIVSSSHLYLVGVLHFLIYSHFETFIWLKMDLPTI